MDLNSYVKEADSQEHLEIDTGHLIKALRPSELR